MTEDPNILLASYNHFWAQREEVLARLAELQSYVGADDMDEGALKVAIADAEALAAQLTAELTELAARIWGQQ